VAFDDGVALQQLVGALDGALRKTEIGGERTPLAAACALLAAKP
jgi:hypothetical protein